RQIGVAGFTLVIVGLVLLATTVQNDWRTTAVIISLMIVGTGEGALLTLLFNVLVSSSPKEQAGDVGALRGVANNLATGLGTAFAGVVAVGVLALLVGGSVASNPIMTDELMAQLNLDNVNFVTNAQLEGVLEETSASPEQVAEAVRINEVARLRALQVSFLLLAVIGLFGLVPAMGLPSYNPAEITPGGAGKPSKRPEKGKARA
ncbi:MAG: MFS transporter, partial [Caldilineaceae bacterium]